MLLCCTILDLDIAVVTAARMVTNMFTFTAIL